MKLFDKFITFCKAMKFFSSALFPQKNLYLYEWLRNEFICDIELEDAVEFLKNTELVLTQRPNDYFP